MFTGLVEEVGTVLAVHKDTVYELLLGAPKLAPKIAVSESLCTNGVCLTVTKKTDTALSVHMITQTLEKTNLGGLQPGDQVNLEPSLTLQSKIGGHFVTGDIDGMAIVSAVVKQPSQWVVRVSPPQHLLRYIAPQGRVTLEGTSLTVAEKQATSFDVCLIPYTLQNTTLQFTRRGNRLNLEVDILAKYVQEVFSSPQAKQSHLTADFLRQAGY